MPTFTGVVRRRTASTRSTPTGKALLKCFATRPQVDGFPKEIGRLGQLLSRMERVQERLREAKGRVLAGIGQNSPPDPPTSLQTEGWD